MPESHFRQTTGEVALAAAEFLAGLAEESQSTRNRFTIALSGAATPFPLYRLLASSPWVEHIAWDRWHIFWGDERCVPSDHQDSNYRMAKEAMLDHISMPLDRSIVCVVRLGLSKPPRNTKPWFETCSRRRYLPST